MKPIKTVSRRVIWTLMSVGRGIDHMNLIAEGY